MCSTFASGSVTTTPKERPGAHVYGFHVAPSGRGSLSLFQGNDDKSIRVAVPWSSCRDILRHDDILLRRLGLTGWWLLHSWATHVGWCLQILDSLHLAANALGNSCHSPKDLRIEGIVTPACRSSRVISSTTWSARQHRCTCQPLPTFRACQKDPRLARTLRVACHASDDGENDYTLSGFE